MIRRLTLIQLLSVGIGIVTVAASALVVHSLSPNDAGGTTCNASKDSFCYAPHVIGQLDQLDAVQMPKVATPAWLGAQSSTPATQEVTYVIATKGTVTADVNEFTSQVNETLNSPLGWSRLGVKFSRVESGGQFTIWLSEASQVPSFSPSGCDTVVSCTVGNNVIINETRWLNGSDAWNNTGGSLRNYRHMVLNHETGHWLGHGHEYCSGAGQDAPVMQQQTINMQGCKPNPWPLASEMYAPKLGIRS